MVHAQPMATLPEPPQQEQQPIVVLSPTFSTADRASGQPTQPAAALRAMAYGATRIQPLYR